MMSILRAARDGFFAAAVAVGLGWVSGAMAQNYPAKPIRLVVPFAPGGPADVIGRIIGQQLDIILGQSIVVENRGGAGGTLGARLAAMAEPDGYTVMFANTSTMSINPAVYRRLDYDPAKAFAPVALIGITSNILVVNPALPVKTVAELVAYGKANPGRLSYSTPGVGTPPHMLGEMFKQRTGLDITHVPYKGGGSPRRGLLPGVADLREPGRNAAPCAGRPAPGACGDQQCPQSPYSGCAHCERSHPGLRVGVVHRHRGARRRAGPRHREAERCNQRKPQGPCGAGDA